MRYAGETELFPLVWGQIADRFYPPDRPVIPACLETRISEKAPTITF
ncbi:hypothetical protein HMPREF1508_1172 [Shuttleworthella sp. MSX8B]|nr:hypothetical protein HMPREF1508_1172 [Shuttleworthia sp. MSX8B]